MMSMHSIVCLANYSACINLLCDNARREVIYDVLYSVQHGLHRSLFDFCTQKSGQCVSENLIILILT